MSLDTVCFSMYSLISKQVKASLVPKKVVAKIRQSSVLPTPVGPQNMRPAMGLTGSRSPKRARLSALQTDSTASFWPMMLRLSSSSKFMSRADSLAPTRSTAIPVHSATICATSSSMTCLCNDPAKSPSAMCCVDLPPWPILPWRISNRPIRSVSRNFKCCARSYCSATTAALFSFCTSSSSRLTDKCSWAISAPSTSWKSCCLTFEPASSITSIALSGKLRSAMYCDASLTAATSASGV
mmetsp:Transcript_133615/g.333471  ORF Transcript_133615/g.333471 Transcript_133615/m.333471 type:complete len:240 (+) Transcript_133615:1033-1752(+)